MRTSARRLDHLPDISVMERAGAANMKMLLVEGV